MAARESSSKRRTNDEAASRAQESDKFVLLRGFVGIANLATTAQRTITT